MFGANYFGQPYFGQGYPIYIIVVVSGGNDWPIMKGGNFWGWRYTV